MYTHRPLGALYPDLERLGAEYHAAHHEEQPTYTGLVVDCVERLTGRTAGNQAALVLGCGPKPKAILELVRRGYDVTGVEPVALNVASAQSYCGNGAQILQGAAERTPVPDESQSLVLMESVLEHVESVRICLDEVFRVLAPGGVLFVYTTNRLKLSLRGFNGEYRTPFLNWFPRLVQECYVHHQLHFAPELANYNERPAVHWFSYADLCAAGRDAGFARFYSYMDLVAPDSQWAHASWLRRTLVTRARLNPWFRALALTQAGGSIFMVKR